MNAPVSVLEQHQQSGQVLGIVDCDIHPFPKPGALEQYMPERWRKHLAQYGKFNTSPYADRGAYPRFQPFLSRRDLFPPDGGAPVPMSRSSASNCWTSNT